MTSNPSKTGKRNSGVANVLLLALVGLTAIVLSWPLYQPPSHLPYHVMILWFYPAVMLTTGLIFLWTKLIRGMLKTDRLTLKPTTKRFRIALLVITPLVVILIIAQYESSDTRLQQAIEEAYGIEQTQAWVVSILDDPSIQSVPAAVEGDPDQLAYLHDADPRVPDALLHLDHVIIDIVRDADGKPECIQFGFGGGFHHYGVRFGRPEYEFDTTDKRYRWCDGVWGWQER